MHARHMMSAVLAPLLAAAAVELRTFGTGRSAFVIAPSNETDIFSYHLSDASSSGVLTHFWITGGTSEAADNMTVRYYVDGENTPSIEFKPPMAAGVGFDDQTVFGHAKAGRASTRGGWFINYKVPFGVTLRVTASLPSTAGATTCWVIVRGCENMPVHVGSIALPPTARLSLHKIEGHTFQPAAWVPILDLRSGRGLVYQTAIQVSSSSASFWEGCFHLYTPHEQPFPGVLLGTGFEDFYDSSFGFSAGPYRFPTVGCTHKGGVNGSMDISAYRFHEEDPVAFSDGVRFVWRVGDYTNPKTHPKSPKCFIDVPGPGDELIGKVEPTTVTSYAWVYTW